MIAYTTLVSEIAGKLRINNTTADRAMFKVDACINEAQRHLLNILPERFIPEMVKTVRMTLTINVSRYQWPSDFIRFLNLWIDYNASISDTNFGKLARIADDARNVSNLDEMPSTVWPVVDLNVEGGYEIRPMPTATVTDGIRLQYVQLLPTVSSTQNCLLRDNLRNLMVNYATFRAASIEGSLPDVASAAIDAFDKELEKYIPKSEK